MIEKLFAGTPLPDREVAGLPEQITKATPEKLRAFYQRTYTPERMTVIVTGVQLAEVLFAVPLSSIARTRIGVV